VNAGLLIAVSYLIGSIPTGYWLGKLWKGIDVRQQGSGNLGATNVFRVLGPTAGATTLLLDIAKGAAPVLWAEHAFPGDLRIAAAAGVAAILGHTTSVFVNFHGGKGVATSTGVFAALLPIPALIAVGTFGVCLALTRRVSASSIGASIALAVSAFFYAPSRLLAYTATAVAALVIWRHRGNIQRLIDGTEPRIDRKPA
jgi:glycerol-3-phosphate acyltransferase PlsY